MAQEWSVSGAERLDHVSARLATGFRLCFAFAGQTYLRLNALVLPDLRNSRNVRCNGEIAIGAPLTTHLALEVSQVLRCDYVAANRNAKPRDRFLAAGVQGRFQTGAADPSTFGRESR